MVRKKKVFVKNELTIIPFQRAFRDVLKEMLTTYSAFRRDKELDKNRKPHFRDYFLAFRRPLETVRTSHTRLAIDKPLTCVVPIEHRHRGGVVRSEVYNTLTARYNEILAIILDCMKNAGIDLADREAQLKQKLDAKRLPITHFDLPTRERRAYHRQGDVQLRIIEKRDARFDRRGRALMTESEEQDIERCYDILRILNTAISRDTDFTSGRSKLGRDNIAKGKPPGFSRVFENILGTYEEQTAAWLSPSDTLNVAIQGHVNPAILWPDLLAYADLFDLAVLMGKAVGGHRFASDPTVAATYLADIKRSWPPRPCDPRAAQDRDWYARELRECLDKPAYAVALSWLEHAIATIPESEMRETIPRSADEILYVLPCVLPL